MATKRTSAYVHPSRKENVPQEPRRKKQKPDNAGAKSFKKAHPVNDLKSQVRSLKRLLARNDGLPADVRVEKERALRTAQHELEQAHTAQQRNEMIGKYHKIRFFDRQKASKRLKRAQKEFNASEEDHDKRVELEKRVQDAEVDVNYTQYYPLDRHYVSLFPRQKTRDEDDDGGDIESFEEESVVQRKGDAEMWSKVKECMANGMLNALRNGKLTATEDLTISTKANRRKPAVQINSESVRASEYVTEDAEDSRQPYDGNESDGFFE